MKQHQRIIIKGGMPKNRLHRRKVSQEIEKVTPWLVAIESAMLDSLFDTPAGYNTCFAFFAKKWQDLASRNDTKLIEINPNYFHDVFGAYDTIKKID